MRNTPSENPSAKRKAGKRRKPKRKDNHPVYMAIAVQEWDWSFWFGVSEDRRVGRHYDDYRHLDVTGAMVHPPSINAETAEVHFLPEQRLNAEHRNNERAITVGSLRIHQGHVYVLLTMPQDALEAVLTVATAGRLCYVIIQCDKPRYGNASVRSFRIQRTLDEDDLPG